MVFSAFCVRHSQLCLFMTRPCYQFCRDVLIVICLEYGFQIKSGFFCNRYQKEELQDTGCKYFDVTRKLKGKSCTFFTHVFFFFPCAGWLGWFFLYCGIWRSKDYNDKKGNLFFFTIVTNFAYEILSSANLSSNTLSFFFCMIFQGKQDLEENGAVEIARCSRGQYFGELALVTNKPRAASAFALGTVKCLGISQYYFISNRKLYIIYLVVLTVTLSFSRI